MTFGTFSRFVLGLGMLGAAAVLASAWPTNAQETEDEEETEADVPTGLAVDGVIRSNRGGFAFPDGSRMSVLPRLEAGGPFSCTPDAGESRSCPLPGEWDLCTLSGVAMSRFNAFVETSCDVVDRGGGRWTIDIVSSGQFIIRCSANCMKLSAK